MCVGRCILLLEDCKCFTQRLFTESTLFAQQRTMYDCGECRVPLDFPRWDCRPMPSEALFSHGTRGFATEGALSLKSQGGT